MAQEMIDPYEYTLAPKLKALFLKVWNGHNAFEEITPHLHYLDVFFPRAKIEEALKYLVKNNLTGKRFVEWFMMDCDGSQLEMHRELLKRVEKDREARRLFAQNDLRN